MIRSWPLKSAAGSVTVGLAVRGRSSTTPDHRATVLIGVDGQALAAELVAAEVDAGRRAEVGVEQAAVVVAVVDA